MALEYLTNQFLWDHDLDVKLAILEYNATSKHWLSKVRQQDGGGGRCFRHAPVEIRAKKPIILEAIKSQNRASYVSILSQVEYEEEGIDDREIVLKAVEQDPNELLYASYKIRNDKQLVFTAVERDVVVLQHASEMLQKGQNNCNVGNETYVIH